MGSRLRFDCLAGMSSRGIPDLMKRCLGLQLCLSLGLGFSGCYEGVPPLVEPAKVVVASARFNLQSEGLVMLDEKNQPLGSVGAVDVRVTNLHNEYLVDDEQVDGEVTIYMKGFPERRVVVKISKDNVVSAGVVSGGVVTIAPNSEIRLVKQWPHMTEQGKPFISFVPQDEYVFISTRTGKSFMAWPVHLIMSTKVRIFRTRPTEYVGEQEIVLNYTYG